MTQVVVAEQDDVTRHRCIAKEFLASVLGLDADKVLLTDESQLSDFFPSGLGLTKQELEALSYQELLQRWDRWVVERVRQQFAVQDVYATMPLTALFEVIEDSRKPPAVH